MIKVVGARRLLILLSLVVINCVLAGAVYLLMMPENDSLQQQLTDTRSKVGAARSETQRLKNEFADIQRQKAEFHQLQLADFFTTQDRVLARDRFAEIQNYSRVLLASYDIKAAVIERTDDLTAAGQVMLTTPVTVSVDALDDMDFYNFLYLVKNAFPGHAGINKINVSRVRELDDVTLRQIGSGVPTVMVKGMIDFTWKTMVPEKQLQGGPAGPAQAGM